MTDAQSIAVEAVRDAIEPLLKFHESGGHEGDGSDAALARIRAAIAAMPTASEQEPVAWMYRHPAIRHPSLYFEQQSFDFFDMGYTETPLYAHPAPSDQEKLVGELVEALGRLQAIAKDALPKFNWGASALDNAALQALSRQPNPDAVDALITRARTQAKGAAS